MFRHLHMGFLALGLVVAPLASPARAADLDKYLPDDTQVVMSVNLRQILDSKLVQKYGLDQIKELLKSQEDIQKILKDLGLDPLKDIDGFLVASPGIQEDEKGLIIVQGRFDVEKIEGKGEEILKDKGITVKVHKEGKRKLFEVNVPNQPKPMFACVIDKNTIAAAPDKGNLLDTIAIAEGSKKSALKNKELQALLKKVDPKQSAWAAFPASALPKELPIDDANVKKVLEGLEAVSGGFTVADDIKIELVVMSKDADGAKATVALVNEGLTKAQALLLFLGDKAGPAGEILKSVKATAKDKTTTIKALITADNIEKLTKP